MHTTICGSRVKEMDIPVFKYTWLAQSLFSNLYFESSKLLFEGLKGEMGGAGSYASVATPHIGH